MTRHYAHGYCRKHYKRYFFQVDQYKGKWLEDGSYEAFPKAIVVKVPFKCKNPKCDGRSNAKHYAMQRCKKCWTAKQMRISGGIDSWDSGWERIPRGSLRAPQLWKCPICEGDSIDIASTLDYCDTHAAQRTTMQQAKEREDERIQAQAEAALLD